MIVLRRRLIFWLIKAYLKRWGRNIIIYFAIGLIIFFALNTSFSYFVTKLPFVQRETIGMVGPYTVDNLPDEILSKVSRGLTKIEKDGSIKPDVAEKWEIAPNGKGYAFYLKDNIRFSDGSKLTSKDIDYGFSDVDVQRPNDHTIVFNLKDVYSPFLTTVSRPIFKKGFVGLGEYKIKKIDLNGDFVESIELYSEKSHKLYVYNLFYPTTSSLKTAFSLGELSKIDIPDLSFKDTTFKKFKNVKIDKKVDYTKLATLFYDTKNNVLSSKTLREGLGYTMPTSFSQGERNVGPLSHFSFANQEVVSAHPQDLAHAKELIDKVIEETATESGKISVTIDTLAKYEETANELAKIWKPLNVEAKIKVDNKIPSSFQIFLGEFNVPTDPDQYTVWHSSQVNNITHYDNKRIDKLLEDGRKELDTEKRKSIYADFQKYLLSDPPASFLFFPYYFEVSKD